MGCGTPRVLVIGEQARLALCLLERLRRAGCALEVVASCAQARALLAESPFDLVLCSSEASDSDPNAPRLTDLLEGSQTTVYYWLAVQDSCWWLLTLEQGQRRWGRPALRPAQFARALDDLLEEIKRAAPESSPEVPAAELVAQAAIPPPIPPKKVTASREWSQRKRVLSA